VEFKVATKLTISAIDQKQTIFSICFMVSVSIKTYQRKKMGSSIKLIALATNLLFLCCQPTVAGENGTYGGSWRKLANESDDIFVRKGICVDKRRDCSAKELVLGSGTSSGIELELYEIDLETVNEILALCFSEYEQKNRKMAIRISVYKESHRERVNKFFGLGAPKPYLQVIMAGE
jgi:hypothetical protein